MVKGFEGIKNTNEMIKNIVWEGPQFGYQPIALLNRQLCLGLIDAGYDLSIIAHGRQSFAPETNDRFHEISDRFNKRLKIPADIHVCYQRQSGFTPPEAGYWIIMQNWEFGSLPKAWIEPMRQVVDEIWVPSLFARECFIQSGVPDEKVFVVPGGVDTRKFQPALNPFPLKTKKRFKFLSVCTTIYRKAIEVYCATFTSADDVCLVIKDMGGQSLHKGKIARKLISDIWEKDDAPEIEYVEQNMDESNLAGLYNSCDCLFHPYGSEGFGLPIAEAMACGLPVIITDYGSVLDFCSGDNAYLIPSRLLTFSEKRIGDKETVDFPWLAEPDLDALKGILRHVVDHPEEARKKGEAGRIQIETNFTWKKAAKVVIQRFHALKFKPILRFEKAAQEKKGPKKGLVSIIIRVSDDPDVFKRCFESIKSHTPEPHEIIFVENGCKKAMLRWIEQAVRSKSNYRLINAGEEAGLGKCYNKGMEASSGEYIVLLRDNIIVADGWLDGMLKCINSAEDIGIVGPMTNSRAAGIQCAADVDGMRIDYFEQYAGAFRARNRCRRIPSREIEGFCMLFRRSLVKRVGLFDEELEQGCESYDYCFRAALEGYHNTIAGDVFVLCDGLFSQGNKRSFKHKWHSMDIKSHDRERLAAFKAVDAAENLYHREEFDKAVVTLIDALKYCPDEKAIYHRLAEMLIDCKRFKEGFEAIKSLSAEKGPNAKTLELAGYCKEGMELYAEADRFAGSALSLNPSSGPALNLKGMLAYKSGDKSAAEGFFNKAIASDPGYGNAYTNMGILVWDAGRKEDALELLEKGCILSPVVADNITAYHSIISEMSEFARAENIFRETKMLYPQNRRIVFFLIDSLIRLEKYKSAIHETREAMIAFGVSDGILAGAQAVFDRLNAQETEGIRKKPVLSLCMIVKDEEDCLGKCLMSAIPFVDEIVIVDTGSTDRTKAIAKVFGATVYDFEWHDDFSEARNFSLSKAAGDWILVLDANEVISQLDYERLTEIVKNNTDHPAAYSIITKKYAKPLYATEWTRNDRQYIGEEDGAGRHPTSKVRFFTNDNRIFFQNPVHEIVEPSLVSHGIKIRKCDITIHHFE